MKSIMAFFTILIFSQTAFAAKNSVVGSLGFDRGAMTIGAEFENRNKKSTAWSAFLLYGMDNAEYTAAGALVTGKLKTITIGGGVKLFMGTKRWKFFVTPAFGLTMVDYIKSSGAASAIETETAFGPIIRTGIYYRYSKQMAFGLDYTRAFNWFSDNLSVGQQIHYTTIGVRYTL